MWKGFAHQYVGFVAAGIVAAALFYFFSPYAEKFFGAERIGILQVVLTALFAVYGIRLFGRFVGNLRRK
jgi:hypothetical protein